MLDTSIYTCSWESWQWSEVVATETYFFLKLEGALVWKLGLWCD